MDLGPMARRPRGADPPRLAPSPERTLPAHEDKGRLSDDRRRRSGDLDTLRRSPGAPGMVRGPAVCDQRTTDAEPRRTRSRDRGGAHTATSDHWVEVLEAAGVPCG